LVSKVVHYHIDEFTIDRLLNSLMKAKLAIARMDFLLKVSMAMEVSLTF
jgi:hypothetical protein